MNTYEAKSILHITDEDHLSADFLKSKYRSASQHAHPDRGGTNEQFILVKEAYEFLLNEVNHVIQRHTVNIDIADAFWGTTVRLFGQFVDIPEGIQNKEIITIDNKQYVTNMTLPYNAKLEPNLDIIQPAFFNPLKMIAGGPAKFTSVLREDITVMLSRGQSSNSLIRVANKGYWKNSDRDLSRGDLYVRPVADIRKIEHYTEQEMDEFRKAYEKVFES